MGNTKIGGDSRLGSSSVTPACEFGSRASSERISLSACAQEEVDHA